MLDVVVPQDDERPVEPRQLFTQQRLAARARDEVARDRNEIGLAVRDPVDRSLDGSLPA